MNVLENMKIDNDVSKYVTQLKSEPRGEGEKRRTLGIAKSQKYLF